MNFEEFVCEFGRDGFDSYAEPDGDGRNMIFIERILNGVPVTISASIPHQDDYTDYATAIWSDIMNLIAANYGAGSA